MLKEGKCDVHFYATIIWVPHWTTFFVRRLYILFIIFALILNFQNISLKYYLFWLIWISKTWIFWSTFFFLLLFFSPCLPLSFTMQDKNMHLLHIILYKIISYIYYTTMFMYYRALPMPIWSSKKFKKIPYKQI